MRTADSWKTFSVFGEQEQIIGGVLLRMLAEDFAEIHRIAVCAESQHSGVGSFIVQQLKLQYSTLLAYSMGSSVGFFEKMGFLEATAEQTQDYFLVARNEKLACPTSRIMIFSPTRYGQVVTDVSRIAPINLHLECTTPHPSTAVNKSGRKSLKLQLPVVPSFTRSIPFSLPVQASFKKILRPEKDAFVQ